jgi:protein-arginine kinase activator protein McsA
LTQLQFSTKLHAPTVAKVITRTSNVADMKHGIQPSQLEVAECFATKGTPLKRIKTMGRGRTGKVTRPMTHIRLVLREIDFKLRMFQAPTLNQKKRWFQLSQLAAADYAEAKAKRDEIKELEQQAQQLQLASAKNK